MRRVITGALSLSAGLALASCGGDEPATVAPPPGTAQVVSVTPCLNQIVPGTGKSGTGASRRSGRTWP